MDINRLTQKSQEALHDAQVKAVRFGHVEMDGEHLLCALVNQHEGLIPRLLMKMDIQVDTLTQKIEEELQRRPRQSGSGAEQGKVYVTQRFNRLLVSAEDESKRLKDEYVSVEHLMLAIIKEGSDTAAGKILQTFGYR